MLRKIRVAACIVLTCLAIFPAAGQNSTFKVMTQNMDAGTDLGFALYGLSQPDPRPYVDLTLAEITASGIPQRAEHLAAEIENQKPDIVSLQEVFLWRTGLTPATANTVLYDQLQLLMAGLQGPDVEVPYRVVAVNNLMDAALPTTSEGPGALRLTDRDVMLARADLPPAQFQISNVHLHVYKAALTFGDLTNRRGFITALVRFHNKLFRIANTHLENPFPGLPVDPAAIQLLQAQELVAFMHHWPQPVILSGDYNSDAIQGTNGPGPDNTATATFIEEAGYADSWAVANGATTGPTWPLFLEDQAPPNFFKTTTPYERIDLIFSRGLHVVSSVQVGAGETYPYAASDHTGVVTTFQFAQ